MAYAHLYARRTCTRGAAAGAQNYYFWWLQARVTLHLAAPSFFVRPARIGKTVTLRCAATTGRAGVYDILILLMPVWFPAALARACAVYTAPLRSKRRGAQLIAFQRQRAQDARVRWRSDVVALFTMGICWHMAAAHCSSHGITSDIPLHDSGWTVLCLAFDLHMCISAFTVSHHIFSMSRLFDSLPSLFGFLHASVLHFALLSHAACPDYHSCLHCWGLLLARCVFFSLASLLSSRFAHTAVILLRGAPLSILCNFARFSAIRAFETE